MDTADRIIDDILACMGGAAVDPTPAKEAVDYLDYRNYKANRESGMTAGYLATLWPQTGAAMEAKFEAEVNAYAESKIRADKEARNTGGPEHDLDLVGRILRAGS